MKVATETLETKSDPMFHQQHHIFEKQTKVILGTNLHCIILYAPYILIHRDLHIWTYIIQYIPTTHMDTHSTAYVHVDNYISPEAQIQVYAHNIEHTNYI